MELRVLPLPIVPLDVRGDVCIVVDVIRATTALITLFGSGCRMVYLSRSRYDAGTVGAAVEPGAFLTAEADDGSAAPGYEFEPSPALLANLDLSGRTAVLATANGTPTASVVASEGAHVVLFGALRNLGAVADRAASEAMSSGRALSIVCSGRLRNSRVALEDLYCAGALVDALVRGPAGQLLELDDSAQAVLPVARAYSEPYEALLESRTGQLLVEQGKARDLVFAAAKDATTIVPALLVNGGRTDWPVEILDIVGSPPERNLGAGAAPAARDSDR